MPPVFGLWPNFSTFQPFNFSTLSRFSPHAARLEPHAESLTFSLHTAYYFCIYSYLRELNVTIIVTLRSQKQNKEILLTLFREPRTVFRLNDVAMLISESDSGLLRRRLNYFVHKGKLLNPRRGIYAKPGYEKEELACLLYSPSYISLQYVLRRSGVIFQYGTAITPVSYLNRSVEIDGIAISYRKIKGTALVNTSGIIRQINHVNIATPERAFLDLLYLENEYHFDNLASLDTKEVSRLLPLYQSKELSKRVRLLFENA